MTMKGEPVPAEGLDHIKALEKWLEQYPNDVMVRSKLADLQRDPRFAEPDEPDDIMPPGSGAGRVSGSPRTQKRQPGRLAGVPGRRGTSGSPSCAWMNI